MFFGQGLLIRSKMFFYKTTGVWQVRCVWSKVRGFFDQETNGWQVRCFVDQNLKGALIKNQPLIS